jgi:hypothetical protein
MNSKLEPFHKTKTFKKLTKIYYQIDHYMTDMNNGKTPLFIVTNKLCSHQKDSTNDMT